MPGGLGAGVEVPVVLGEEIDVVEDEALPLLVPHGLRVPHVEQHGAVELGLTSLQHAW